MDEKIKTARDSKRTTLLRAIKDRKLRRVIVAQVAKS